MRKSLEKPIFVVGSPRSGTTILRMMIDCHPNISTAYETRFLAEFTRLEQRWRKQYQALGFDRAYWIKRTRQFYGRFHEDKARQKGKTRWCEKSPEYVFHLEFIKEVFPDAQIVHIVRDGRAVVRSFLKRWGLRRAIKATRRWGQCVRAGRAFAKKHPDQYLEIQYEELVNNTEAEMRRLFEFLGEPWDEAVLSPYEVRVPTRGLRAKQAHLAELEGSKGIHSNAVDDGKDLNILLRQLLYRRSGDQMRMLNYL